jgi:hypothetical protein
VASPTDAFRRVIRDGENGCLAATAGEWEARLLALIDDPALRRRLGNRARDDVFLHATPAAQADTLVAALAAFAARAPGAASALAPPDATAFASDTGRYDLAPDDLLPGTAVEARDTPAGFPPRTRSIGQRFRSTRPGLCRIDVQLGTDGRGTVPRLVVTLATGPEGLDAPLRRVVVAGEPFADGAWVAARFDALGESAGRELYVSVHAETAADEHVTLWTYTRGHGDAPPDGLHLDHAPVPGSLTFRTFHTRDDRQ